MSLHAVLDTMLPQALARDIRLSRTAKFVYTLLRSHPKASIQAHVEAWNIPETTLRRHLNELEKYDWAYSFEHPDTRRRIYVPWMPLDVERTVTEHMEWRLQNISRRGQRLTGSVLAIIVDDNKFVTDARLKWVKSSDGHVSLEFDWYYYERAVAIEFQGRQHYEVVVFPDGATNLQRQREIDGLKALTCQREGITLIEVPDVELSPVFLTAKLRSVLPLLPPRDDRPLFQMLRRECRAYAQWAQGMRGRAARRLLLEEGRADKQDA